jgi:hypothetical protein
MSAYLSNLSIISPSLARFVASELQPQSLTKKDIIKCLKALGINNSKILRLQWKEELWINLQLAAEKHPILVKSFSKVTIGQKLRCFLSSSLQFDWDINKN